MGSKEKKIQVMYGKLRLKMYNGYGLLHCEIIDVVSRVMNGIILRCMIDFRYCEKQLYWNMELYRVITRVVLHA